MGGEFCNNVREIKVLFQYLRDKKKERKKGAQKKGGENSPISPPLDPRLPYSSMNERWFERPTRTSDLRVILCAWLVPTPINI